ncbi:recombinase family protein [Acutalibacter intestini]|uniref:recombinase family protein n=1 Tax=Acutalibacter intestini TaxID=3093659 RepID=UPI002AC8D734|nr:recombinase family protein [Acutalibacter sp. M00204]
MTVAKYVRISDEDRDLKQAGKTESNSIANQRNLLDSFIARHDDFAQAEVVEFCDDGWSGKNFERPGVRAMLEQVKRGKIQCIVVKDLSRFGRDYLTVGTYISKIFPFMGVRFIAVNDGLDSANPGDVDSLDTSFKALLYDLYSRDLSRKVKSAKRFRAQRGDFVAPFAPYGYQKNPENHNQLIIDPPAAEVVRRVFRLIAEGHSAVTVARMMNDEAVLTPMLYKRAAGCSRTRWSSVQEDNFWTDAIVTTIIRDERYIGTSTYGRRKRDVVGSTHTVKVSREDWVAVANAHDAIVTREEFDRAQAALRMFKEHPLAAKHYPLAGKIRCGVCGHSLSRSGGKERFFFCKTAQFLSSSDCVEVYIPEGDVLAEILKSLRIQAEVALDREKMLSEQRKVAQGNAKAMLKRISALQEAQFLRNRQIRELYEAFALGEVGKEDYLARKAVLSTQNEKVSAQIAKLQALLDTESEAREDSFVINFKRFHEVGEVSDVIIPELLKEVIVYPHGRFEVVWKYQDNIMAT